MALVFQYGSNTSSDRLNHRDRLKGDAKPLGIAVTDEKYDLVFDVWSETGNCAAADIVTGSRRIWGVVYEIPDDLIERKARPGRKSLDAIEGESANYKRVQIKLRWRNGRRLAKPVITYVVIEPKSGLKTAQEYVGHILKGLQESKFRVPSGYVEYVKRQILKNNASLKL